MDMMRGGSGGSTGKRDGPVYWYNIDCMMTMMMIMIMMMMVVVVVVAMIVVLTGDSRSGT